MGTSALQKYWLAQYLSSIFILNSSLLAEARNLNTTFLRVPCRQDSKNQINSRDFNLKWEQQVCGGGGLVLKPAAELWLPEPAGGLLIQRRLRQWKQVPQGWHSQVGPGSGGCAWEITAYSNVFQTTGNEIYLVSWYKLEKLNKQNRIV